jgi:hypothetical protein
MRRVEWVDVRQNGNFRIIAEETADGWTFFEMRAWEIRWSQIPADERLVSAAEL